MRMAWPQQMNYSKTFGRYEMNQSTRLGEGKGQRADLPEIILFRE